MATKLIALEAENMIIEQEVTSAQLYKLRYQKPTWPGNSSGPTIGIGVDLGYTTHDDLEADWGDRLPAEMISQLHRAIGVKGDKANILVRSGTFNKVIVSWEVALAEFEEVEIPRWIEKTKRAYPGVDALGPLCLGAMVSLCFNRGTQLNEEPGKTRRLEMRRIRDHLVAGRPELVPAEIRSMKRLWTNGLVKRREVEARLFEQGLEALRNAA